MSITYAHGAYSKQKYLSALYVYVHICTHTHELFTQKQWGPSPAVGEVQAVQAEISGGLGLQPLEAEFRFLASD